MTDIWMSEEREGKTIRVGRTSSLNIEVYHSLPRQEPLESATPRGTSFIVCCVTSRTHNIVWMVPLHCSRRWPLLSPFTDKTINSGKWNNCPSHTAGKGRNQCLNSGLPVMGFPGGSAGKESTCNAGGMGSIPGQEDPWRRKWQSTPVFLPGKFHRQRSLAGYSPWGCKRVGHN